MNSLNNLMQRHAFWRKKHCGLYVVYTMKWSAVQAWLFCLKTLALTSLKSVDGECHFLWWDVELGRTVIGRWRWEITWLIFWQTDRYNRLSGGVEGGSCAQHVFALVHCRWILHQICRSGARTCTSCMCALLAPVLSPKTGASTRYRLVSEFQHS